jgi:hypothetical protein
VKCTLFTSAIFVLLGEGGKERKKEVREGKRERRR